MSARAAPTSAAGQHRAAPAGLVLRIVGPSGSGKTTLAERLVEALTARGLRVAAAKSARHHAAPADRPGSDTERLLLAGAVACAGGFADGVVIRTPPGDDFARTLRWLAAVADVVIVEGGHELDLPALELVATGRPRSIGAGERVARVTAERPGPGEFLRDDIEAIATLVIAQAGARAASRV